MKIRNIIAAGATFVALASPVAASELPLFLGIAAANAADVISTRAALKSGAIEANPLMTGNKLIPMKIAGAAGQMWIVHRLWKRGDKKWAIVSAFAIMGVNGMIAHHNFGVAKGY